jgi:hypothetical protein
VLATAVSRSSSAVTDAAAETVIEPSPPPRRAARFPR